jgi:hypothetical protein
VTAPIEELGTNARALVDAARPALGPGADAARRMRAKIAIATAGGAGAAGAASAKLGLGLAAKLGIVAAIAAVVGSAVVVVAKHGAAQVEDASRAPIAAPPAAAIAIAPVTPPPPVHVPMPEQEMPAIDLSQKPRTHKLEAPAAAVGSASEAAVPPARPPIALSREVALVDQAMAALRAHDATRALATLKTYAAESAGKGQLAEDAAAIEVEALCTLHDGSAADHLATFDTRFPSSAQRTRLTQACR